MKIRVLLAMAAAAGLLCADTLTLRNGNTIHGQYLGGSARQIRMAVGDNIQVFAVGDVAGIQFEGGETAAQAAPMAAPAAPVVAPAPSAPVAQAVPQEAPAPAAAPEPPKVLHPAKTEQAPTKPVMASSGGDEIPAGTSVTIRTIDDIDSKTANVGQTFKASVDEPVVVNGREVVARGADATVKLVELKDPSKLAGGGQLTLDLASITINGKPAEVASQSVTQAGESRKKETGAVIGGTAALGAIIGAIAGGGKGAAIGAISGAGAGTAVQVLTKGTQVRVPSETRLTFTLQQPVRP